MVAGECDLARAREVEVLLGEVIDLVGVSAEESGSLHDLGPDQGRRDERREARLERPLEAEVHDRELESCADAPEEVEACAADLRAALHVDGVQQFAELQVVARLEVERGDLAHLMPNIWVNPQTFAVMVDDDHVTVEPPRTIAFNQTYFFS